MASEHPSHAITSFRDFYQYAQSALHDDYRHRPWARVRDHDAFEELRHHLLKLYEGVEVAHSFVDVGGQVFDCVPIDSQPSLKQSGGTLAKPPSVPAFADTVPPAASVALLHPDKKDAYGNTMFCPPGTVPIRRVTLGELSRFETLGHFLRKGPRRLGRLAEAQPDAPGVAGPPHQYAHASQTVDNIGGHSFLNVWTPPITGDQVFSLAQQWYSATGPNGPQTAEVGWQVFPQKYGHSRPVLFTYWTADGYQHSGSYSNDAANFVQVSAMHAVGMALETTSVAGGAQAEVEVTYLLSGGNWWLYVNGTGPDHALGYYPVALYQGGPMASHATDIDFGGETLGTTSYPPMGSGAFAEAGIGKAAYQRNVYYFPVDGGSRKAMLIPWQQWPGAYTIAVQESDQWGQFFHFGGPGGAPGVRA